MPGQTTNGFPYPVVSDPIPNGPVTIQALAQKSDDVTAALGTRTTSLEGRTTAVEGRVTALENEPDPGMPPGPLTLINVTTNLDPSDAFLGESVRYARFGALVVLVIAASVRAAGGINANWLGLSLMSTGGLPTVARPLVGVTQRVGISAQNDQQIGQSCSVSVATNGSIAVRDWAPGPVAGQVSQANASFTATFVYPGSTAAS